MQPAPQLLIFAETLLGENFPEFHAALNDFPQMEPKEFGKKYPCYKLICDNLADMREDEDEEEMSEEDFSPVLLLLYAEDKNLMARVDWAGEDEPGAVAEFVTRMLALRGIQGFSWNTEEFNASLDLTNMRRGEYVPLLLKAIDRRLQELGCRLIIFFIGDDSYPFAVLKETDFAKVDRLTWGGVYGVFAAENMNDYRPTWDEEEDEDDEE